MIDKFKLKFGRPQREYRFKPGECPPLPIQRTGPEEMLHQRPGMNQFRFDALIRIAHDHFIAVSEDGRFDRSYHPATSSNGNFGITTRNDK